MSSEVSLTAKLAPLMIPDTNSHQWAIILAGGEGERLRPTIERWLGRHCPKQYCTFIGRRSMLEHTFDRTRRVVHPRNILTVVAQRHSSFLASSSTQSGIAGRVIVQPENKDTGPGVFLPATYIMAADPSATVFIFPSDHFVFPEDRFLAHVRQAGLLSQFQEDRLVLLAARALRPEQDYGWIEPGVNGEAWTSHQGVRGIVSFREKPSAKDAEHFFSSGYLWNTMIMFVKIKTLWSLGHRYLPEMMRPFEELLQILQAVDRDDVNRKDEQQMLSDIYGELECANFSRELLQAASKQLVCLTMDDIEWSDWGSPLRIQESLARIGKRPSFFN